MSNLLYLIALILIVSWAISLFVWRAGSMVHVLIVLAVAILVLRFFYSIRTKS